MLLLHWEVIMKKKTKWELSALVSSRSLDERTAVETRLMASTWHHDVDITILFLVLKAASEEHNVIRMLYCDMDFCLPTPVLHKISTKANIQMGDRGEGSWSQICTQESHCQVPSVARHASHWLWYDIILQGQMECIRSEHFSEECLSRPLKSVFGDIGAAHADLVAAVQSFCCVLFDIHGRGGDYTCVKGGNQWG